MSEWFQIDKAGLAAILERRGKFFAVAELVSNAWDSGSETVAISLSPIPGQAFAVLEVEDRGEGFADLDEARTMFARSRRAGEASKRGRFNVGEKLVLACCRTAKISTRCGYIEFKADGSVRRGVVDNRDGTTFTAEIKMTREEYAEVCDSIKHLIPPVHTTFNGAELDRPDSLARFDVKLPTEIADSDGQIRRTVRTATVEVYESLDGHGELLELGVPVVETDNGYRVNVLQKVPLNVDRDNVTPAFIKAINVAVLNHMHDQLTPEAAAAPWTQEAAGDARAAKDAVRTVIAKRFGERAVIATPGDPIANATAERMGFTVIPGGALSADTWSNVRKHELLKPSAKVFPTPSADALAAANEAAGGKCPLCGK